MKTKLFWILLLITQFSIAQDKLITKSGTITFKASVPSFEVVQIMSANYPTGDFSSDKEPVYIVKCRYNGL